MRSSKSRSRSKSNRNRSVGNVVNRVFDSSGPEGKVRGTPQQIIDKYNQLTRDAQLSNDRVAAENFQQHAEHYLRMLTEALREQQERQLQQQQQQQDRQQRHQSNGQQNPQGGYQGREEDDQPDPQAPPRTEQAPGAEQPEKPAKTKPKASKRDGVIDTSASEESGLVETPENQAPRPRRSRRKPDAEAQPLLSDDLPAPGAAE